MNLHRNGLVAAAVAAALLSSRIMAADAVVVTDVAVDAATTDENALSEVIVTGTRQSGIKAIDSAAPIQVIGSDDIAKTATTPDLISTLANLVPALDVSTSGGDLSNLTLQAALRYLSPNDTLVLINGKRRHTTSNIAVGASGEFTGGAGADLNFIPADAIDHVEVLTDGAAAQYGSDAIAGVINIILKKGYDGGNLNASYGGYQDGGGKTDDVSGNIGFQPYDGSYFNLTGEFRNHGHSVRSEPLDYTLPAAFNAGAPGTLLTPIAGLYPAAGLKPIDSNALNAVGQPVLNLIAGDAEYQIKLAEFNSGFKLDNDVEFYSFGTWGQKSAGAYENYRLPHIAAYTPAGGPTQYLYPYGFDPIEAIQETDYGLTGGLRGVAAGWNWDVSSTYGRDFSNFYTEDSANTAQFADTGYTPTNFYDGSFKATQWTNNLDLDHEFEVGLAGPLNVALGAEQRRDTYDIGAGIPLSYQLGGGASFAGFSPTDAGFHSRTNAAGYFDLAATVVGNLRLDVAGRYEDYSDFGAAKSGKLTARYDFTPAFALRGTVSNGFRAPTVAEEYYTKTSTSPTSTGVQLGSDSPAAALFGLGNLKPETSVNYSVGAVFTPVQDFTGTLDLYHINLDHRIVSTQSFYALLNGIAQPSDALVTSALNTNGNQLNPAITTTSVNFFTNGVDTSTQGADLVLDYVTDFDRFGHVDWSAKINYNDTTITAVRPTPAALTAQGLTVLNVQSFTGLTSAQPKYDINLGTLWTYNRLTVNLHEIIHDTTTVVSSDDGATTPGTITYFTSHSGVIPITDIDIGYDFLKSLKLSVGAVDAFNRYPDKLAPGLLAAYQKGGYSFAATQYATSPIGTNGGYYYVKATYSF
jgi:iron complex outermembrane receptor protein